MDEKKIAELFREAVPETPPSSFSQDDVVLTSNRQRLRRNRVVAGTALGVVLVAGGVSAGLVLSDDSPASVGVAAAQPGTTGNADNAPYDAQIPGQEGKEPAPRAVQPPANSFPTQPPEQGGSATGEAGSPTAGGTPTGCQKVDGQLAAALASELPSAAGLKPSPTNLKCPDGVRAAAYAVRDGNAAPGVVSILLIPKSTGTEVKTAFGPKGGEIVLVSVPPTGSTNAPFDEELAAAAKDIAKKY
jgi:hypothetical protein